MLKLLKTCFACPEQYDVYDEKGQMVAYFRLRHGVFRADLASKGDDGEHVFKETVYESSPLGDGIFKDKERVHHLNAACRAVEHAILHGVEKTEYETVPIYEVIDKRP